MTKQISLSDGEWRIMNCLWEQAPRTITQLVSALKAETAWTKHTVISMLTRMEAKDAVHHREGDRAKQYYPSVPRADIAIAETASFLGKVYGGSLGLMVNSLIREKALTKTEIDQLYEILRRAEQGEPDRKER